MALETKCAWCGAILLDAAHAKEHVIKKCPKAPWRADLQEAARLMLALRLDYCSAVCPKSETIHEATCAEAREWLDAHPFENKEPPHAAVR